jgi:uncharacterized protein YlaN (UPF0358 family)
MLQAQVDPIVVPKVPFFKEVMDATSAVVTDWFA